MKVISLELEDDFSLTQGVNYYVYSCYLESDSVTRLLLSKNSTYPNNYTPNTSRKLGVFYCLHSYNDIIDYEAKRVFDENNEI